MFITDAVMINCINTTLPLNLTGTEFVFLFYVIIFILKKIILKTKLQASQTLHLAKKLFYSLYFCSFVA